MAPLEVQHYFRNMSVDVLIVVHCIDIVIVTQRGIVIVIQLVVI